ncbi:MAG: substrate-binding periplasmic protein [Desulfovibrionaceae bacterium]
MPACRLRASLIAWMALVALGFWSGPVVSAHAGEQPVALLVFDRPPYYALENGQPAGGFVLDITLTVFEQAGIPVVVREMPPNRILAHIETHPNGSCAVGWLRTPEREVSARFSLPLYVDQPLGVVTTPEKARELGPSPRLKDLLAADLVWGARQGFSYGPVLDKILQKIPAQRRSFFSDTRAMLRLVAQHRLDAMLIGPEELSAQLRADPALRNAIRFLPIADAPPGFSRHIMCDLAVDRDVMARLDAAIQEFRETERYRLLTRFHPGHEETAVDRH